MRWISGLVCLFRCVCVQRGVVRLAVLFVSQRAERRREQGSGTRFCDAFVPPNPMVGDEAAASCTMYQHASTCCIFFLMFQSRSIDSLGALLLRRRFGIMLLVKCCNDLHIPA